MAGDEEAAAVRRHHRESRSGDRARAELAPVRQGEDREPALVSADHEALTVGGEHEMERGVWDPRGQALATPGGDIPDHHCAVVGERQPTARLVELDHLGVALEGHGHHEAAGDVVDLGLAVGHEGEVASVP